MSGNRNSDQTLALIIKLNFLVLGLGICIYTMYALNKGGLPPSVAGLLGMPTTNKQVKLNWCDTRVLSMSLANGRRVYQDGRKWMAEGPMESGELNFIEVERWFGNYCKIPVTAKDQDIQASALVAAIEFIDGAQAEFKADGQGHLSWKGQAFSSPALESAFLELMQLPVVD